jgi:tRNA (guanine-N7-)-methyltransferase
MHDQIKEKHDRQIRSFVRRDGRITPGQSAALEQLFPVWGLEPDIHSSDQWTFDWAEIFGNDKPPVFEIGFGNGGNLLRQAAARPGDNFVGIEVYRSGCGQVLMEAKKSGLENIRVICEDAVQVLSKRVADQSLSETWLFFPDPWHKKRHNKRRIIQPDFAALVASKLLDGGLFQMATDWAPYAEHMLETMNASPSFANTNSKNSYIPRPDNRILTHFEQRGLNKGHEVADLLYQKK